MYLCNERFNFRKLAESGEVHKADTTLQRERECSQLPFKEQRILLPSMCLTSDRFRDFELQISDFGAYGQWLSLFVSDFR